MKSYKLAFWLWAPFILISCHKDSEVLQMNGDYLGVLTLEYSRSFPPLNNTINIDLEIKKTGEVVINSPEIFEYDASDEVKDAIKIRETGHISVNSLLGKVDLNGSSRFVEIKAHTTIKANVKTWGWDDKLGWVITQSTPVEIVNPVKNSLKFDMNESSLAGDEIDAMIADHNGNMNFKWSLLLFPKLER
jgi:hypothetical protein